MKPSREGSSRISSEITTLPQRSEECAGRTSVSSHADAGAHRRRSAGRGGQDAVRRRRRRAGRGGPHEVPEAGHGLRLHAGGLRGRAARSAPRGASVCGAGSRPRRWSTRCCTSRACFARAERSGDQRRLHGDGRAVPQLRRDPARVPPAQRPGGVRPRARGPSPSPPSAWCPGIDRFARGAPAAPPGGEPARRHRRAPRPPRAAQPHVPARRGLRARARGTCGARAARCSSSTWCSTASTTPTSRRRCCRRGCGRRTTT